MTWYPEHSLDTVEDFLTREANRTWDADTREVFERLLRYVDMLRDASEVHKAGEDISTQLPSLHPLNKPI